MDAFGLFWVPNWLLVIALLCLSYYLYMTRHFGIFKSMGVDGPKPTAIMGNWSDFTKQGFDATIEYYKKYNKVWGHFETCQPVLMVGDLEMLKQILVKDFNIFNNRRAFKPQGYPLDRNIAVLEDDHWKHVRNTLTPTFSGGKLKKMIPLISQACDTLVENVKLSVDKGEDMEIKELCGAFTMDGIASTAFGVQIDSQRNPDDPFVQTAKKFFQVTFTSPAVLISIFLPFFLPVMEFFKMSLLPKKYSQFFVDATDVAIDKRINNKEKRPDFLQLMLDAEKEGENYNNQQEDGDLPLPTDGPVTRKGLTREEIHAQAMGFFLAGYDTTSSGFALTLYNLAVNPDCQDRVVEEVDRYLPLGATPSYDSVSNLKYLEMCLLETLRLYPPAGRFERICGEETTVGNIRIPKGMIVGVPVRAIQLDPEIWPDPKTFNPERFSSEARARQNPYTFMPFGYGPRNCIGMRFALMEIKLAIARLLQKFRVVPCEKTKVPLEFKRAGSLQPIGGLWVKFEERT